MVFFITMPILITKGKSVPNQPGKVLVGFCCPLSAGMITESTFLRIIGETVFLGNISPIIVPLREDDRDHLTGLQGHFHYVFVGKCHSRKHRARIIYEDVDGRFLN
jgi:hypothetical protein